MKKVKKLPVKPILLMGNTQSQKPVDPTSGSGRCSVVASLKSWGGGSAGKNCVSPVDFLIRAAWFWQPRTTSWTCGAWGDGWSCDLVSVLGIQCCCFSSVEVPTALGECCAFCSRTRAGCNWTRWEEGAPVTHFTRWLGASRRVLNGLPTVLWKPCKAMRERATLVFRRRVSGCDVF